MKKPADLIISNAVIYTVDSAFSSANCMVIRHGRILKTGDSSEILKEYDAVTRLDLHGSFIYPGFIDAHSHFTGFAKNMGEVDLTGANSFKELVEILKDWRKSHDTEWIAGFGWDQNRWPVKKFPENTELDILFPGVPIVLSRIDGHAVLASSEAIRRAKIGDSIPDGQAIFSGGRFTGVFLENTAEKLIAAIPEPSEKELDKLLADASLLCLKAGLTSVADAGLSKENISRIGKLQKSGKIGIRIYAMLNPDEATLSYYLPKGVYLTDKLTVRSIKMYADGALGSRGACLLKPYSDDPSNSGMMVITASDLKKICKRALDHGYQVNTHCIGDSANRFVLQVYGGFLKGKNDLRWRIEHAQVVDPNDFQLFEKFSVIPCIQSTHATSDMIWAEQRLGPERIKNAYAYKQLLRQNGWLPNGTDFPIEQIYPLNTFYSAIFRKNQLDEPAGGWQMENAFTRQDALRSITIWAAKGNFEEKNKGSLERGKVADFVVLDKDIMVIPEKDILKTRVIATYLDGEKVTP